MKEVFVFGSINADLVTSVSRMPTAGETIKAMTLSSTKAGKEQIRQRHVKNSVAKGFVLSERSVTICSER